MSVSVVCQLSLLFHGDVVVDYFWKTVDMGTFIVINFVNCYEIKR